MRSPLAYSPRPGRLQQASAAVAVAYLGSLAVIAFLFSNPIVLAGAGAAVAAAGLAAGAGRALAASLRWGLALGVAIVAINALVTDRGATVLVRGFDAPVLGRLDVTLESLVAGGVLALRIAVVMMAFAVYSSCVDPDRVLRALRPIARRSALTATLVARMVPLAASDLARLREGAALRGPAAAPAGRAALARRLVAGSLDRAVDVAATLELRGYGLPVRDAVPGTGRSRHDRRFLATGLGIAAAGVASRIVGLGGFDAYPEVAMNADPATLALAAALPPAALVPLARTQRTRSLEPGGREAKWSPS